MAGLDEILEIAKWVREHPELCCSDYEIESFLEPGKERFIYYHLLIYSGGIIDYWIHPGEFIAPGANACTHVFSAGPHRGQRCGQQPPEGKLKCIFHHNPVFRMEEFRQAEMLTLEKLQ